MYFIGRSTLYQIISNVCEKVWEILSPIYLPEKSVDDWINISNEFERKWNFPNCLGAIDGKHIRIKKPPGSGSLFFNYKKYYSFVLMALCDADYRFTWIDVGDYGSLNDSSVFNASGFGQELAEGRYPLPHPKCLPGSNESIPYFFIGDEAFGLRLYLMRPFSRRNVTLDAQKLFNYCLSHARMSIEDTFGILASVWQILHTSLDLKLETSIKIVQCLACLHNFLLTSKINESAENRQYVTEDVLRRIRERYSSNKDIDLNLEAKDNDNAFENEEIEHVEDEDEYEGNGINNSHINGQKMRNILTSYFERQNNEVT
ncbi:protein ALP1-like isoform X2 [Leptopilina heterotoma]|nr:protein ALP1-like isoform X2 [Leptopilina heterotoma]XP_043469402.1 protein ALP1-like isoform X2 [Leptopilina heterotoma]